GDYAGETNPLTITNVTSDMNITANFAWSPSLETDFIFDANTGAITGYTGSGGAVVIPFTIGGVSVTSIGNDAFLNCPAFRQPTRIAIPSSVKSIGDWAFSGCSILTSIAIPSGVTSIGAMLFESCSSLADVTIPDSVTSIGESAFKSCTSLASITIPGNVTSIGKSAFSGCTSLDGITIPAGVTEIGESTFNGCSSLTALTIPDGITTIGDAAFYGTALTSITIAKNVTSIGIETFNGCPSLTKISVDSDNQNYSSTAEGVLFNKDKTTIIAYPGGKSGPYAIPAGVTSIVFGAFNGCESLNRISIPASLTSVGDSAFSSCTSLASVYFYGNAPGNFGLNVFAASAPSVTIFYNSSSTGFTTPTWNAYPCQPVLPLVNGKSKTGIAGLAKYVKMYSVKVPAGQTLLEIRTAGGTGDCDIDVVDPAGNLVKQSKNSTGNELVQISNNPITEGDWLIYLYCQTAYAGTSLTAKYSKQTAPPAAPAGVNASDGLFSDKIVVTWTPTAGATKYTVGRKNKLTDENFTEFETADNTFEDISEEVLDAPVGTLFYYSVKATNTVGYGKYSTGNSGYIMKSPLAPGAPVASDGTYFDKIRISWTKVTGAISYQVYRAESLTGGKTRVGETTALFLDDFGDDIKPQEDGVPVKKYWYWVEALNQKGIGLISSKSNDGFLSKKGPATVTASNGTYSKKIVVTWSAVPGATAYDLYRYTDPKFSLLDKDFGKDGVVGAGAVLEYDEDDQSAAADKPYYYKVKAKYT
ncbi:MAG: leucine-rich repeat protein, partial [Lentisphaerae bacterium]|nr:leucine-rich repeat protein [Lentisphaerota bacterium]